MFMKQYAPNRCEPNIEVLVRGVGVAMLLCFFDQRINVIAKMLNKVGWVGERGGGNKELVIVKIAKKTLKGVRSRGDLEVRVDANDELKLL